MNPEETAGKRAWIRLAALQLLAALAFGGLSFFSLNFAGDIERHVSPVWPASGLAMAILFYGGRTFWVAIFLGALASNSITTWMEFPGVSAWRVMIPSLGIAVGATLEALVAAWFLRAHAGGREFCLSAAFANAFVLRVALASSMISALIGPSFLLAFGIFSPDRWIMVVLTWFVGDATGILVFGAMLVFPWRNIDTELLRRRWAEIFLLVVVLAVVGGTMTDVYDTTSGESWPRAYMILPVVLWAIFRFNHLGTMASLVFISLLSIGGSVFGHEVFPSDREGYALLFLQLFLLIVSSVAWAVCGRVNELQILSTRLEDLVASRVVIQRDALRQREERLAVLAHDLQVPLIGIRNMVALLLNPRRIGDDPEKTRRLLTEISEASEQARALAERLLTEQEVEHQGSCPEPVDWVELVAGVARRAGMLQGSRYLYFAMQNETPRIEGSVDRVLVLQVLENLCHNAAKVSPLGGTITLGIRGEGDTVVVSIADKGPGFRREEIPALFTKVGFHHRIRTKPGSTGLGLFIVGKAVRELGGTITCESSEGQGALFTIRLPRQAG